MLLGGVLLVVFSIGVVCLFLGICVWMQHRVEFCG